VLLLGWHFASDVLAGFCVGAAWTLTGLTAARPAAKARLRSAAAPAAAAAAALAIGAAFAAVALARTDPALVYARPTAAFVAFALVIAPVACAPAAGLAVLLAGAR
jgi:hypothetical protein